MALTHSTAQKNHTLDSGFKTGFDTSGVIRIYSGSPPGANNAVTGTLLSTLTLSATSFGSASGGVSTAGAIASDTNAAATGTAGYFRVCLSGDAGGATGSSDRRIEGTVGTSGADMNINNTSITAGGTVAISSFTYTHPA